MVECHLAKVDVEGSSPFSRSTKFDKKGQPIGWPFLFLADVEAGAKSNDVQPGADGGPCHASPWRLDVCDDRSRPV